MADTRDLIALFDDTRRVPARDSYYWEDHNAAHNETAWAARLDKMLLLFWGR